MVDSPHDALRRARIAKGFSSAAEAARYFGWKESTYVSHENGTRGIRPEAATQYAKAFGINPATLLAIQVIHTPTAEVQVIGTVAYGVWRDKSVDEEHITNKKSLSIPAIGAEGRMRYAVVVSDESFNKAIQRGEFAIFTSVEGPPKVGQFVYVERVRGNLVERSIRRVSEKGKGLSLTSWSRDPRYTDEIPFSQDNKDVSIIGLVVGKYASLDTNGTSSLG